MNKFDFNKLKPLHKFLLIGVLPIAIIAVVLIAKNNQSTAAAENEVAQSPFLEVPTERDTFANKSNIDIYKENKYQPTESSFGGALDIDVTKQEQDTTELFENESIERQEEKKSSYKKSSGSTTHNYPSSSYSSNNSKTHYSQNNTSTPTEEVDNEEEDSQRRRRTSGGSTTTSSKATTSGKTTPMIKAVIHNGNKAVKSGSTVRIRISQDCMINGVEIKRNTIISAIASFSAERIKLNITSLSYNGQYIDTKLTAYDLDGIQGIFVPGGIKEQTKEDVGSSGADAASGTLPIIGGLAKDLVKKSIKEPSAIIYDNHKITLRQ